MDNNMKGNKPKCSWAKSKYPENPKELAAKSYGQANNTVDLTMTID
jgi:hypothetical protein